MKKIMELYNALDELAYTEMQNLPSDYLFRFTALCAQWADLGHAEMSRRISTLEERNFPPGGKTAS